jgi:hypothetical protein
MKFIKMPVMDRHYINLEKVRRILPIIGSTGVCVLYDNDKDGEYYYDQEAEAILKAVEETHAKS